jgi:hypothetical protein
MNRHDEHQSKPREQVEPQPSPRALPLSNEELRRQLGWELVELTREHTSRSGNRHLGNW